MNRSEVQDLLSAIEQIYPGRVGVGSPAQTLRVWTAVLADMDARSIAGAAMMYFRETNPHPPSPGELIALCREEVGALTSHEAWGKVIEQIHNTGYAGEPELDELTLAAIQAVGGEWPAMCRNLQSSEVPALRARFLQAYTDMAARDNRQKSMRSHTNAMLKDADALSLVSGLAAQYDASHEKGSEGGR